jgi:hypothetical protein
VDAVDRVAEVADAIAVIVRAEKATTAEHIVMDRHSLARVLVVAPHPELVNVFLVAHCGGYSIPLNCSSTTSLSTQSRPTARWTL